MSAVTLYSPPIHHAAARTRPHRRHRHRPGRGAVGIVRVSGKGLASLVEGCAAVRCAREATYLPFGMRSASPWTRALALYFPAPPYTGEDVLELQAHGGPVVLQLLLARCPEAAAEATLPAASRAWRACAWPGRGVHQSVPSSTTRSTWRRPRPLPTSSTPVLRLRHAAPAARSAARSRRKSMPCAMPLIHLRMLVEATLDFPRKRKSTSCARQMRVDSYRI